MRLLPNLSVLWLFISTVFAQPFFTSFEPQPAPLIEWDQQNYTYYTGQTLVMNWTSQNFLSTDLARIQYVGTGGIRTLTTGSGAPILNSIYSVRLSDSANGLATTVPLTIAHATNTTNALQSTTKITVIQSKLMNILAWDGNRTLGSGQNTVCDDRNLTVTWRGLGEAQFGMVSIVLRRQNGIFGTQTLASVSNIPVYGNTTLEIVCPRTTSPSSSNSYAFQLTVNEPGGTDYTGTSPSFNVATAATPSPTPSQSPTSSKTSTPTPSSTPSPTSSPSQSNTPTPTMTPTISLTPSTTETARPSIDYGAIGRAAASQVDTVTPAIAGAFGGIGGILLLVGALKWYQNKQMTQRRKQKLAMTSRFVQQASAMYGIHDQNETVQSSQPSIVMYTVANLPQQSSSKKGFTPKPISK